MPMAASARSRRSLAYTTRTVAPLAVAAAGLFAILGTSSIVAALVMGLPWLAWRYDNATGVFFPLAVLLLIVLGILGLILMLMAVAFHGAG